MNIIEWAKSIFRPKNLKEYYVLEQLTNYRFVAVTKYYDPKDQVSVLRYKLAKTFGATTNYRKADKMCKKLNIMIEKQ